MSAVYLIHFDRPYKHAQHYLGFAEKLEQRVLQHYNSTGARLLAVVNDAGIHWTVVRVWEGGDRSLERRLKHWHKSSDLCPICLANRKKAHR